MTNKARSAVLVVTGVLVGLMFLIPGPAFGGTTTPYPAPPITSTATTPWVATNTEVPTTDPSQIDALPNTGLAFNMGATIAIGAAVVVVGILLVVFGARRARRQN
jgi:LPXTG-motif cell wall-anchored protein